MKTKKKTTWSELREMVMAYETHEYRIKLLEQKVEDLGRLVYKDAEVIDLDKAEELKGADDSGETQLLAQQEAENRKRYAQVETLRQNIHKGKGDDGEEVGLTRLEISRLLAFLDNHDMCGGIDDLRLIEKITPKLNKMLNKSK